MNNLMKNYSRLTLVIVTTLIAVVSALLILYVGYGLMGVEVRKYELIVATIAPIIITSIIAWYLYGLLKKLEQLEEELRHSISKEKETIYVASIQSAQHVINNLLNQLKLVELEVKNQPDFDKEVANLFVVMLDEAGGLMKQLSSVKQIDAEEIKRSVSPQKNK